MTVAARNTDTGAAQPSALVDLCGGAAEVLTGAGAR